MKHINIFLLSIFVALASCSFTTKTFDNPDKDKLLILELQILKMNEYMINASNECQNKYIN